MLLRDNYNTVINPYKEASIDLGNLLTDPISGSRPIDSNEDLIIFNRSSGKANESLTTDNNSNSNRNTIFNTNFKNNTRLLSLSGSSGSPLSDNL